MENSDDEIPMGDAQLLNLAVAAQKRGAYQEAFRYCQQVLKATPDQPDALRQLAEIAAAAGQGELSVNFFRQFVNTANDQQCDWATYETLLKASAGPGSRSEFIAALSAPDELGADDGCQFEFVEGSRPVATTTMQQDGIPQIPSPAMYETRDQFILRGTDAIVTPNFLPVFGDQKLAQTGLSLFTLRRALTPAVLSVYTEIKAVSDHNALLSFPQPQTTIEEPAVLVTGGPVGPGSYYHWLIDYVTRLWVFDHSDNFKTAKLIVDEELSDVQQDSLTLLGVAEDRLIRKPESESLHCLDLIAPSFCTHTANVYPKAVEFVRRHLLNAAGGNEAPSRRIYISRREAQARRLENEDEVEAYLIGKNFEIVVAEHMSLAEQIETFRSAYIVVAPHGGGFTNIAFAPIPCPIIEIVTKRDFSIFSLASALGHPHYHIAAEILDGSEEQAALDPDPLTYRVPMEGFTRLVGEVLDQF